MQRRTVSFTFDLITFDYLLKCDQKLYSNIDFCQAASILMTNTNDDDDKYHHDRGPKRAPIPPYLTTTRRDDNANEMIKNTEEVYKL